MPHMVHWGAPLQPIPPAPLLRYTKTMPRVLAGA